MRDYLTDFQVQERRVYGYIGDFYRIILKPGKYFLECYGAAGGEDGDIGGAGGYTSAYYSFSPEFKLFNAAYNIFDEMYVYVFPGGAGYKVSGNGAGWNGGGRCGGGSSAGNPRKSGGGGGATDIRFEDTSIYSRVIVAGGGGGDSYLARNRHTLAGNYLTNNNGFTFYYGQSPSWDGGGGEEVSLVVMLEAMVETALTVALAMFILKKLNNITLMDVY